MRILRALAERFLRADGAVGPDFDHQPVVVGVLPDPRALHVEVHAAHGLKIASTGSSPIGIRPRSSEGE